MGEAQPAPAGPAAPPTLERARPLGISSGLVFIIGVVVQAIGFLGNFFISHRIGGFNTGITVIGISGLYLTIASTINGMADLRIGSAYTYFIARGRDPLELTGTYVALRFAMVGAVTAGLFLLAPFFYFTQGATACYYHGPCVPNYVPPGTEVLVFGIFLLTPILWSPGVVYTQLWVAKGDSIRAQYPVFLQSVVQTIGLIVVAFAGLSSVDSLYGFALAYVVGGVASAAFSLPTVLRYIRSLSAGVTRRMFHFAWPLMGGLVLTYLWTNAPPLFVAVLGGTAVAIFLAANGFRILLLGLPAAVSVPLFPHLTNLHVRREYEQLRRRTWQALRYTAMVVVPVAIAMVVYRTPLLNTLFVGKYTPGAVALALLAASAIPASLSQIILTALTSVGRQRLDLYLTALQAAVLLAVMLLVLPPFAPLGNLGITGAAEAVLVSSLAGLALNIVFLERILAVRIQPLPIGAILLSSVASFGMMALVNDFINPNRWFVLFPAILLGFGVYYLVLSGIGELSKQDVRALVSYVGLPAALGDGLARLCWQKETRDAGELLTNGAESASDEGLDATRVHDAGDTRRPPRQGR